MIKVKDLYKVIDGEVVLDHLNMQVEEGSIYGLIGPNGAGKTTLIRHLVGVLKQDAGKIFIESQPVYENIEIKRKIGYKDDTMDDTVYLKEDDFRGLKYALRKDYETLSMDTISDAINNYKYSIEVINDADYVLTFYINKDFENTVTYFKKRGYKLVAKNS